MTKIFTLFVCPIIFATFGYAQVPGFADYAINSTIKIETVVKRIVNGKVKLVKETGSGFFFQFETAKGKTPLIITNKHVIKGASSGILYFHLKTKAGEISVEIQKVEVENFEQNWILHPDPSVDLAIMPMMPLMRKYSNLGKTLAYAPFLENHIPSDSILATISPIEDILMIGYPFGLRDTVNNLPVVRRGITATPAFLNYNSAAEFLCDIPDYGGSSGSPIIILNNGSYNDRNGRFIVGSRFLLLGINYATYIRNFEGRLVPKSEGNIQDSLISKTAMPYNIAIVIKSRRILDFKHLFE
jgi:hypothetical protein